MFGGGYRIQLSVDTTPLPIENSYWVIPQRFMAGEYPGSIQDVGARAKLHWLLEQQANFFLDLTETGESDLKMYTHLLQEEVDLIQTAVIHKRLSIRDLSTPAEEEMVEILDTIDTALSDGQNIYMHCFGGKGRTGTVVGCYLVRHGMEGDKALELIQKLRSKIKNNPGHSPETEGQRRMVIEWTKGR